MSESQVQVEAQENSRRLTAPDEFFFEYLRSHRKLAQEVVDELIDNIRIAVLNRQNIKDTDKSFFLVNLGGLAEAFKLLRSEIEVAEQIEDNENLENLNEAFIGAVKSLIKVYYNITEDLEPFDKISADVYYNLTYTLAVLLDVFITKLGDKISKLKSEKS